MAKREFVNRLAVNVGVNYTEHQIESICRQTPNDFDEQWVIDQLTLKTNPSPQTVIKTIKASTTEKPEHCGKCIDGKLTILDPINFEEARENGMPFNSLLEIPTSLISCPNCGKHPDLLSREINSLSDEMQGWLYVTLYNFYAYHLQGTDPWRSFRPNEYWNDIYLEPGINAKQTKILNFIHEGIKSRGVNVPDAPVKIQKLIETQVQSTAVPF